MQFRVRAAALAICLFVLTACIPIRLAQTPIPSATPTPPPLGGVPSVEFFVYPDDDEQALIDKITAAKQRVFMKMYLLTDWRIIDAMVAAEKHGADVRAMIEENPFGGGSTARQADDRLKKAGIRMKFTNPTFRFTHEKSFVIDNQGVILTANMTKSAFSRNREFGAITSDPADVAEMVASFNADWNRTEFNPTSANLVWSPINSRERINHVINSARQTLTVYAEVTQDDEQVGLLADAAKRGVNVRLIVSPSKSSNEDDTSGNEPDLNKLQKGRVKVRYVKSPYIHAKMFVADNTLAFIGSVNISSTSLDFNRELGILLADPNAIQRLNAAFEKDWNKGTNR
jgi:phosphatidylserine/phosphatidylglycerophosphate/cardiolipin synthase-like enzyme